MSKLKGLIQERCPNGVKYMKLGDFCEIKTGKGITKSDATLGGAYPIISGGQSPMGYYHTFNREANTLTISRVGAYAGFVNYIKEPFYLNDKCFSVIPTSEKVSTLFLFYVLKNMESKIKELQSEGGVPTINTTKVSNLEIPLPPFEIQEKIVCILDCFTNLTAELQAELQARKEQYEYYKHTIFRSVSLRYKDCLLKEIATFSQGLQVDPGLQFDTMKSGRIRFLRIVDFVSDNEPYRYIEKPSNKYIKSDNELIMIRYGASAAGKVFMCHSGAIANNMFKINLKPEILPKYVMYCLSQNSIYTLLNSSGGRSTMPAINFKLVGSIHIPIPPYSEQQRIVSILDKFEILVNDLQQGLPAEINAVQEQYEYYRNKLLIFPRKIEHTIFS
ncbi:restriction endonuclease subunit S [Bacteroides sp.]|uniref:restriction endonuclease subunit S n=1 Tax=Bacteroides sp. TaxID=29523 RepID=UPI00258E322A|nr:restriction endonuclease subunit S [Bacteroides sp.]